jgi:hypothetical protein
MINLKLTNEPQEKIKKKKGGDKKISPMRSIVV